MASNNPRVSGSQAILQVLADGKPRKAGDITAAAIPLVKPPLAGKTPHATLAHWLYFEAKKPGGAVVKTRNKGEFKLRPRKKQS
jgi:hypothetical protein